MGDGVEVKVTLVVHGFVFRLEVARVGVLLRRERRLSHALAFELLRGRQIRPVLVEVAVTHASRGAPVLEELLGRGVVVELGV